MAMMMAGRVLLVCALCVLCCGAVFGHAMEDYCGEGGGNGLRHTSNGGDDGVSPKADCGLLSTRMALIKAVEAAEAGEESSGVPDQPQDKSESSPNNKLGNNMQSTGVPGSGGSVAGQAPLGSGGSDTGGQERGSNVLGPNEEKEAGRMDQKDGKGTGPHNEGAEQSSSSSGSPAPQSGEDHKLENTSESNESSDIQLKKEDAVEAEIPKISEKEEPGGGKENENGKALTGIPDSQTKMKETKTVTPPPLLTKTAEEARITIGIPAGDSTPAETNGHSKPEDTVNMQQLQQPQDGIESNNNSQTNSGTEISANQQNEPSADQAESTPLPTANGDAANNKAEKSTEEGMPNNGPAADGAETREEKQDENKEANPKETPVEATAMKTTTATTGDSDGSTAVSHTTSPLLLLLLVACAAAVVAA
ncbi:Mucin-associated surface protein (MASP) [Trypanosoma cruzi]|uniref:Mucin-associated surface protein (MASP), putative n=2 Tax=Trypanosoma cruzi TaxID=5693 RepID=Q4DAB0_TRYCC|nr:mucin-associated surface protein (MASP), putative [Trypanosoma cruzi]EAN89459.1 mucin-associated surface protein (MASP), putative [Trypanosoma cruzi]PWV20705.1 Mucin-associated surface protein (MASP) [Trypanosoma cruzi]RNC32420.1 mucin-associated surface protein (MASP) [Trypanosoma cruzi]|eukprot:XP_811310.1 mucin-associated surface protein (MASP) [Trypanosoma cruzi strain CL Brener]